MSRAQRQRRWRANTDSKRIEMYLSLAAIERLDALAAARNASRATIVDDLITDAARIADNPDSAVALSKMADATQPSDNARQPERLAPSTSTATSDSGYRIRRPRSGDEKRYKWIADVDDGTRIALGDDPARFHRWRGVILDGSLYICEAKGKSRDEVIGNLLTQR